MNDPQLLCPDFATAKTESSSQTVVNKPQSLVTVVTTSCSLAIFRMISLQNFEVWNNLSNAYIKMGQKARAWKVLQEAVKCDYDNWKVWDNIMVVSTDLAHFSDVIKAYHRVLDLKERHVDVDVLRILASAIADDLPDNGNQPSSRYVDVPARSAAIFG